jgi:hypothetical protein
VGHGEQQGRGAGQDQQRGCLPSGEQRLVREPDALLVPRHQESEYLRRADATTRYILSGSFSDASGATWFPYKFRHTPGNKIDMGIPWYSGMAQGMMLSTLVNLYETTGNTYWKTQADRVFRSYQVPKKNGQPWFQDQVLRGSKVYMWFEEYVGTNIPSSHVVNGHIYAAWGAYDYYRLTRNPTAQWMFNTSATTIRDYFTSYRRPGTVSWYAASPYGQYVWRAPASYHKGVTNQLAILGRQTGTRRSPRSRRC